MTLCLSRQPNSSEPPTQGATPVTLPVIEPAGPVACGWLSGLGLRTPRGSDPLSRRHTHLRVPATGWLLAPSGPPFPLSVRPRPSSSSLAPAGRRPRRSRTTCPPALQLPGPAWLGERSAWRGWAWRWGAGGALTPGNSPSESFSLGSGEPLGCWAASWAQFPIPASTQRLTFRGLLDPQRPGYFELCMLLIGGNRCPLPEYS